MFSWENFVSGDVPFILNMTSLLLVETHHVFLKWLSQILYRMLESFVIYCFEIFYLVKRYPAEMYSYCILNGVKLLFIIMFVSFFSHLKILHSMLQQIDEGYIWTRYLIFSVKLCKILLFSTLIEKKIFFSCI